MFYQYRKDSSRYKKNKGATLLITVLIATIAATIATFTIRYILQSMAGEYERYLLDKSISEVKNTREKILARLDGDPFYMYNYVLPEESPRKCLVNNLTYQPGDQWPSYCGGVWEYPSNTNPNKVKFIPFNMTSGAYPSSSLILRIMYSAKGVSYGTEDILLPGGRSYSSIYSGEDIDLNALQGGTYSSKINGVIYSNGNITLPSNSLDYSGSYVMSEGAISPTPTNSSSYYASSSPNITTSPKIYNITELRDVKYSKDSLRSLNNNLFNLACPVDNSVSPSNLALTQGIYSSTLCVNPGNYLVNSSGALVLVPATTKNALVIPEGTSGVIDIYLSDTDFDPDESPVNLQSSCSTNCNTDALNYVNSGQHFGAISFWSKLGSFNYPASGVIGSNVTTQLGLCNASVTAGVGSGFLSSTGTCTTWSGSGDGVEVKKPWTLVVGSSSKPQDLYIGGPIKTNGENRASVIASGDSILPYWSRPNNASYQLNLEISILTVGRTTSSSFRSYPEVSVSSNRNSGIILKGVYGGVKLNLSSISNLSVNWKVDTSSVSFSNLPPFLSSPNLYWYSDYSERLTKTKIENF